MRIVITVIEQTISKFIRTQQSSNVLSRARVDFGHWESQTAVSDKHVRRECSMSRVAYVARWPGRREENILHVQVAAVFSVFYSAATLSTQKNRIKNYDIFFLCKLPPLIKYATDKVEKEFLSCTNDQVFVF